MENDNLHDKTMDVYEKLKETPPELRTSKKLSKGIKQDIRCVGLVPEGMQVKDMPKLSKQEIEDIRLVSDAPFDYFKPDAFASLPPERCTEAVSQAAVNCDVNHYYGVPEAVISDKLIWSVLPEHGYLINTVPEDRRTLKMCMTALETYGSALKFLPPEMITPKIAMKAVQTDGVALEFVPDKMKTPQMSMTAVQQNVLALEFVPYEMKTPHMCRVALGLIIDNVPPNAVHYVDLPGTRILRDVPFPEVCIEYLKKQVEPFAPENHQTTKKEQPEIKLSQREMEDIKLTVNDDIFNGFFRALPEERKTELVCLAAVQASFLNFSHVPEKYRTDGMIINILQKYGDFLSDVEKNRRTPEMYTTAIENNGKALMYFPPEMITPDAVMKAVQQNGKALEFVPEAFKTPEICHAALNCKNSADFDVIRFVPLPDVCFEYLKKMDGQNGDPFMVFGNIKSEIITPEMANFAIKLDPSCIQFVPEKIITPEMCMEAVKKDWYNVSYVPEHMKTKEMCELAVKRNIYAQKFVPDGLKTPELYLQAMKEEGKDLGFVPEKYRTPDVCLQAVISNSLAKEFVPERFTGGYNIYDFYHGKLTDELPTVKQLNFEQVQKIFNGESVTINGTNFFCATSRNFTIDYDRKTHQINVKTLNDAPEKKKNERIENKTKKRKGVKM